MDREQAATGGSCRLNERVASAWDANVRIRAEDLERGTDTSYIQIIKPWVLDRAARHTGPESLILDAGCGCGYLSNAVYEMGRPHIQGVDISASSIRYAREKYPAIPFHCGDICHYTPAERYDLCLAVMTLNNLPCIGGFFSAVHGLLSASGRVVAVIPHPCYWPQRHLKGQDYCYFQEKAYEYAFSTKGRADYVSPVLYFHRTLETYIRCIYQCGFQITAFREFQEAHCRAAPDILGMELTRM